VRVFFVLFMGVYMYVELFGCKYRNFKIFKKELPYRAAGLSITFVYVQSISLKTDRLFRIASF
jgi:hypothetical protein